MCDVDVVFFFLIAWFELDKRSVEKMSRFLEMWFWNGACSELSIYPEYVTAVSNVRVLTLRNASD